MNDVTLSGVIKGDFAGVSNDGVQFIVVNRNQRGDISENEEFTVLAYGNSAQFLTQHAESGKRVVIQGRLSSEKLGTENYHTAVTVSRVLSVSDSSQGIDYSHASITGFATSDGLKRLENANQTALIGLNVANIRTYKNREGVVSEYKTYLNGTIWGASAEEAAENYSFPFDNVPVLFEGILKPRTYEKDGEKIGKIDIWINDFSVLDSSAASAAPASTRQKVAEKPAPRTSKKASESPF